MNDDFANMADVHRIIGDLPVGADVQATTDGRDKSVPASRGRLARMVGRDAHELDDGAWLGLAQWFAETQLREIADATMQVLSDRRLSAGGADRRGRHRLRGLARSQPAPGAAPSSISATSSTLLRRRAKPPRISPLPPRSRFSPRRLSRRRQISAPYSSWLSLSPYACLIPSNSRNGADPERTWRRSQAHANFSQ